MGAMIPVAVARAGLFRELITHARLVVRLMFDNRVPFLVKLIIPLAGVWVLSPIDLMPDVLVGMFGLGAMDDLVVVMLAIRLFLHAVPKNVLADQSAKPDRTTGERPAVDARFRTVAE